MLLQTALLPCRLGLCSQLTKTTNLLPQYPKVAREVTAKGVCTVAPIIPLAKLGKPLSLGARLALAPSSGICDRGAKFQRRRRTCNDNSHEDRAKEYGET